MKSLPKIDGGWQIILADPPWRFRTYSGKSAVPTQAPDPYETMTIDNLLAMPVSDVAAKDALLVLWTVGSHLEQAMRLGENWGFRYVTDLFYWVKPVIGMGYHTRKMVEPCLLFKRGRGLPVRSHSVRQAIHAPRRQHSRKPDEQYERLDALYGSDLRCLELFARTQRPGWTVWGNETHKFSEAAA